MDKNKCDLLVKKAVVLYSSPKIGTLEYLRHLECNLNIKLPNDFSYLWGKYNYQYTYKFDWCCIENKCFEYTQDLRKDGLPHRFVLLAGYGDECGSVFMETQDDPEKTTPIYWCDEVDVFNLCEEGVFKYNPTIWPSFTDFFEYLVNEEEKRQLEEGRLKAPIKMEEENLLQLDLF